jgi:hypothetical protein
LRPTSHVSSDVPSATSPSTTHRAMLHTFPPLFHV